MRKWIEICESADAVMGWLVNPRWLDIAKKFKEHPGMDREFRFFLFMETDLLLVWHAAEGIHYEVVGDLRSLGEKQLHEMGADGPFIGGVVMSALHPNGGSENVILDPTAPLLVRFLDYGLEGRAGEFLKASPNFKGLLGSRQYRVNDITHHRGMDQRVMTPDDEYGE